MSLLQRTSSVHVDKFSFQRTKCSLRNISTINYDNLVLNILFYYIITRTFHIPSTLSFSDFTVILVDVELHIEKASTRLIRMAKPTRAVSKIRANAVSTTEQNSWPW